jgi:acetoin utilization protein AcuC
MAVLTSAPASAPPPRFTPALPGPSLFISSDEFRKPAFGKNHPLSISRQGSVLDLCTLLGWLPGDRLRRCEPADVQTLTRFHDPHYVEALRSACKRRLASVEARERYHFGTMENPLFEGLFERAASTVGGSILAAESVRGGGIAFHPAGGTHHGRRDRACGFCYFNDPVFAIMTLLNDFERVMYIDLDAHHGDGVQIAYSGDERVLCLSVHEMDRWPFSGEASDRGLGMARNLPVPRGLNDSELAYLVHEAIDPLLRHHKPDALVLVCGADSLHGDPLSAMDVSNGAMWSAVEHLVAQVPAAVVLGGGGYNPWTTVRYWAGLWGRLSRQETTGILPDGARALLGSFECDLVDEEDIEPEWLATLQDAPREGPIRRDLRQLVEAVMEN